MLQFIIIITVTTNYLFFRLNNNFVSTGPDRTKGRAHTLSGNIAQHLLLRDNL